MGATDDSFTLASGVSVSPVIQVFELNFNSGLIYYLRYKIGSR